METTYVELQEVPVLRVRADMKGKGPSAAFDLLESKLPTIKGRKFYGTFQPRLDGEEYYACVARIDSDDPEKMQLETGAIPGGWYARRRFPDWEKNLSKLPATFEEMARTHDMDPARPSIEFYRSQAELLLFLPVKSRPPNEATQTTTFPGSRYRGLESRNGLSKKVMLTLSRELNHAAVKSLSVAMETNDRGFNGFIVELPGAYVRGLTEEEALSKAQEEARSYLAWLGQESSLVSKAGIVQTHRCELMIEDADCEILLAADKSPMNMQEFQHLVELAKYSGFTFNKLYESSKLKDWVDEARIRKTFYGQTKKTIRETFEHVKQTQYYYVSRTGNSVNDEEEESFGIIRELSLTSITSLFRQHGNSEVYTKDNEEWTLKKILRRFIWHDRIHGKAITRILEKQRRLGLIDGYENPFRFKIS